MDLDFASLGERYLLWADTSDVYKLSKRSGNGWIDVESDDDVYIDNITQASDGWKIIKAEDFHSPVNAGTDLYIIRHRVDEIKILRPNFTGQTDILDRYTRDIKPIFWSISEQDTNGVVGFEQNRVLYISNPTSASITLTLNKPNSNAHHNLKFLNLHDTNTVTLDPSGIRANRWSQYKSFRF